MTAEGTVGAPTCFFCIGLRAAGDSVICRTEFGTYNHTFKANQTLVEYIAANLDFAKKDFN
jgi:hypothetical protein